MARVTVPGPLSVTLGPEGLRRLSPDRGLITVWFELETIGGPGSRRLPGACRGQWPGGQSQAQPGTRAATAALPRDSECPAGAAAAALTMTVLVR